MFISDIAICQRVQRTLKVGQHIAYLKCRL